jgi:hypothetical protein
MRVAGQTDRERSLGRSPALGRLGLVFGRRLLLGLIATLVTAAVAAGAPPAQAGSYVVYTCRTPDGGPAPTDRWVFNVWASSIDHYGSTCPRGAMWMSMDANKLHPKDDVMTALWSAPPDTLIVSYTMWRTARPKPGSYYYFTPIERRGASQYWAGKGCRGDSCDGLGDPTKPLSDANKISSTPSPPITSFGLYLSCGYYEDADPDCPSETPALDVTMARSDITLSDDLAPAFAAAPTGGLLATNTVLSGPQSVAFQAADKGGGIADAAVEVDGAVVADGTFGDPGGHCKIPYVYAVPCPLNASGSLTVDTAKLADGDHRLRLLLRDAGGNVTPWGPITIRTHNAPPDTSCIPEPAVADAGSLRLTARTAAVGKRGKAGKARASLRVSYARKSEVIGLLRGADGQALPATSVCVVSRALGSDDPWQELARPTTGADGRFLLALATGPSREVAAIYRVGAGAVVGRGVVNVVPRVTVKAKRRSLRNGQVLKLTGRVSGGPIPRGGVLINLQAVVGGRWRGFADPFHTTAKGTFTFRYRFTRTGGVQHYKLRVRIPAQGGYPYATGTSKRLTVRVAG